MNRGQKWKEIVENKIDLDILQSEKMPGVTGGGERGRGYLMWRMEKVSPNSPSHHILLLTSSEV